MIAGTLRSQIELQERVAVQDALGQTIIWRPTSTLYARRIPLDVKTVAQYQQLGTTVTDKYIIRGTVSIELGKHRLVHGSRIYEPRSSSKHYDGVTDVVVVEA